MANKVRWRCGTIAYLLGDCIAVSNDPLLVFSSDITSHCEGNCRRTGLDRLVVVDVGQAFGRCMNFEGMKCSDLILLVLDVSLLWNG